MQDYLQRTHLAGKLDEAGSLLMTLALSLLFYLLLWGIRLTALLAGFSTFILLRILRARTRERRLQRREKRLRQQIGGEMKLEEWTLAPSRRAHAEAALLLCEALQGQLLSVSADGALAYLQHQQMLICCAQLPCGEALGARDIARLQRACLLKNAQTGIVCGAEKVTDAARRQALLAPPVRTIDRAHMIALAGAAFPATDAQLVALGRRRRPSPQRDRLWRRILQAHRAKQYMLYGLMLCLLYILTGQRFYPVPGVLCLLLAGACRAVRAPDDSLLGPA